jgi:hypothetical protein
MLSHTTVNRYPGQPERELLKAVWDVEAELYSTHSRLSTGALRHFWSSFELHRHLFLLTLRLWQFGDESPSDVADAVAAVRTRLRNYVSDVLVSQNRRKRQKPIARNPNYEKIDEALRKAFEAHPENPEAVFRILDRLKAPIPNRKVFQRAGGYLNGFKENPRAARVWLSQARRRLGFPAFARGPKK